MQNKPLFYKIFWAFFLMTCGLVLISMLGAMVGLVTGIKSGKGFVSVFSILQNIVAFILPAIFCAKICNQKPVEALRIGKRPSWKAITIVVMVFVVSIPMMNWLVDWNNHLSLPDSMKEIENLMRLAENEAQQVTNSLLMGNSFIMMLYLVFVVGILTGIGEEFFFRGSFLGAMIDSRCGKHLSVWIVGIIFSAIHFQFFGFFPRLILGVWLGYLFVWSGNLWVPVTAHALNNSMVVILTYISEQGGMDVNAFNNIGITTDGSVPYLAIASTVATIALVIFASKALKPKVEAPPPFKGE